MNGIVPALVAVLLAELGPRALDLWQAPRRELRTAVIAALIAAVAVAGQIVAPMLSEWADALLIGLALVFAGVGQFQRVRASEGVVRALWSFWSGGTIFLVFALSTRFGPVLPVVGALAGLAGAVALSLVLPEGRFTLIRRVAAVLLVAAGLAMALGGLRLVETG